MKHAEIHDLLRSHDLKVTPQREAILLTLHAMQGHPSAEELVSKLRESHPSIAQGTVYKTMETFLEKGIIHKVPNDEGRVRYDMITIPHHHLYDKDSKTITDFHDEKLDQLLTRYFEKHPIKGFSVSNIKLAISGKFQ